MYLDQNQINAKINFIENYLISNNAADGSILDSNANVSNKNIATLEAEINKDVNIQVNRKLISNKIADLFGSELAHEYIRQIEDHEIYVHDETSLKSYCASISMYPFLIDGLTKLGGESNAPKHLNSFCGSFVNLVFAISSQFAGAIATVEFLMYFDYYARKDYGNEYLDSFRNEISNHLQHIVYAINQPAAARGYQSVFWNISVYDENYFKSLFETFVFPDGHKPNYNSVKRLQAYFMEWFNKEREKAILTFPVVTAAMLVDDEQPLDEDFARMCSKELSEGNSFFVYQSKSADSLASCCRLRNEFTDNTFSYSLGAGGVSTGSINVITINLNRLVQQGRDLTVEIDKIQKYQVAYRKLMEEYKEAGLLTVYDASFISLDKQFLTIGINGMVESAQYQGIEISNNPEYKKYVQDTLKIIYNMNKEAKQKYGYMFNTEFVPAENLGAKNSKWDKISGLETYRECYNSYFYIVEDDSLTEIDKFILHGKDYIQYLDGGSALHLNLNDYPNEESFYKILCLAARVGCNYFCTNIKITICNDCEFIDKKTKHECSRCGSKDIEYATRVIGYLKKVKSFSSDRQKEHERRYYLKMKKYE